MRNGTTGGTRDGIHSPQRRYGERVRGITPAFDLQHILGGAGRDEGSILDSPKSALHTAYASFVRDDLLGGVDAFGTLTHRGRIGARPGADQIGVGTSEKDVRRWFDRARETSPDFRMVAGMEWHRWRSSPHWHLVAAGLRAGVAESLPLGPPICGPCDYPDGERFAKTAALDLWESWFGPHGIARIERPRSAEDVAGYTVKYVLKQRVGPLLMLGV